MIVSYVNSSGCHVRYPNPYLALLNWFVDVEDGDRPVSVASGVEFIPQMLAAVERRAGNKPRLDLTKSEAEQCIDILRYIHAAGDIKELKIK